MIWVLLVLLSAAYVFIGRVVYLMIRQQIGPAPHWEFVALTVLIWPIAILFPPDGVTKK